ncbi:hypothetical protein ACP70R_045279 [Stipagrostis hirtigluma subsp. patula]
MRAQRGKKSQFWASMLMRKWLNIKPKLYDFSEDEFDTESEDNDDSFFEVHGNKCQISKSSDYRVVATRVMIGTWNVAGRTPSEDIDLDQWLCTQEPADIYVLGFQEVVPLSAGNVLGTEDSRPIWKWEAIIRQTLHKSQQHKTVCKSYSAPVSPLLGPVASSDGHEYTNWEPDDEVKCNLSA